MPRSGRWTIAAVAAMALHAAACSAGSARSGNPGGGAPDGGARDITPPSLVSTNPAADASAVPASCVVSATFSEAVDPASVGATAFYVEGAGGRVPGAIAVAGATIVFTPAARLADAVSYAAHVTTAVRDLAGNPLPADVAWHFSTASAPDTTPPAVVGVAPPDGAADVAVATAVSATFGEALDPASVGAAVLVLRPYGGAGIAGTVSLTGATVTFTPSAPLAHATTYVATVAGVRDAAGNALAGEHVWSFTTAPEPGVLGPLVASTTPPSGASGVGVTTAISVTFDGAIDAATVTATSFSVRARNGPAVAGTFTVSGATVTLVPLWDLFHWTTYDVALSTGIHDVAGHPLQGGYGWSFKTEPDLAAQFPPVIASPPDGAADVVPGARVAAMLNMGGQYDPATVDGTSFTVVGADGLPVPGTISFPGAVPDLARFVPAAPLTPGTRYTATLTTAVRTSAGTPLPSSFTWSFTTTPAGLWDEGFGAAGTVFARPGNASAVAVQPDGKILVAGSTPAPPSLPAGDPQRAFVLRLTAAGAPDVAFGASGEFVFEGGSPGSFAMSTADALALQPDGKILLAGRTYQGLATLGDAFVVRLDASGALDPTFGSGGVVAHATAPDAYLAGLALQGGKIVLATYECPGATCDVVLLRYLGDGTPDPAFGTGGAVTYPGYATGIAADGAGRLLVSGGPLDAPTLRRLLDDGSLDPAFGVAGVVSAAGVVAVAPDGTIALGRAVADPIHSGLKDVVVERLLGTGAIDATFGMGGLASWAGTSYEQVGGVTVSTGGRTTLAATKGSSMAQLLRFTSAGVIDTSFGGSGEVTCCGVGPLNRTGASAIALQPDGKTVFAGAYFEYIATGTVTPAPTYVLVGRLH